jgi:hypothetical protein
MSRLMMLFIAILFGLAGCAGPNLIGQHLTSTDAANRIVLVDVRIYSSTIPTEAASFESAMKNQFRVALQKHGWKVEMLSSDSSGLMYPWEKPFKKLATMYETDLPPFFDAHLKPAMERTSATTALVFTGALSRFKKFGNSQVGTEEFSQPVPVLGMFLSPLHIFNRAGRIGERMDLCFECRNGFVLKPKESFFSSTTPYEELSHDEWAEKIANIMITHLR